MDYDGNEYMGVLLLSREEIFLAGLSFWVWFMARDVVRVFFHGLGGYFMQTIYSEKQNKMLTILFATKLEP